MKSNRRLLFAFILPFFVNTSFAEVKNVQQYLAEGNQYLTTGKFNDAIISYDAAISQDPNDYLSYYKRATAYLSLGRTSNAIDDYTTILGLKPGFDKALLQRAKLYANDGEFLLAKQDLLQHKEYDTNEEVQSLLESVDYAENTSQLGLKAYNNKQYDVCIDAMTKVIRIAPQKPHWRLVRSKCHLGKGEIEEATSDLTRVAVLTPSNKQLLLQVSSLNFFSLYEPERALTQVKSCIHYDPEDKQCKTLFRFIKRIEKDIKKASDLQQEQRYATALNLLVSQKSGVINEIDAPFEELATELSANNLYKRLHLKVYSLSCIIAAEAKDTNKANHWCEETLKLDPNHKEALTSRGELKLNNNDFEGAVRDLEKAFEASEQQDMKIRQLLQRAQQLLKQSKKRDYYKILDIARDADSRTIKRAYRKKAHEWHPDKYSGELNKSEVESKMADINQAYEVLSDPEKKEQFDNGFDPYDPESNQQQHNPFHGHHGGNPFAHHFAGGQGFPFGGSNGGQQFNFHF